MNEQHTIWNEIGTLYFNAGSYGEASKAYQRAIEMGADSATMKNLAKTYTREGELLKAVSIYRQTLPLVSQDKDKADIWRQLGDLYTQIHDHESALHAFEMAAELAPVQKGLAEDVPLGQTVPPNGATNPLANWSVAASQQAITVNATPHTDNSAGDDDAVVAATAESPADEEPASVISPSTQAELRHIPIEQIKANPAQPRLHVNVHYLAESIREYGIIQPLIVSPGNQPDSYILVSGERRLEAARQVGLDTVPAIVRQIDARQRLELALIENVQRQNLSLLEQADAYAQLRHEFGLSSEEIARRIGKSSVMIGNLLRLLELPENIRRALNAGRIREEHARALFLLRDAQKQSQVLRRILNEDLSVRKTEALVRALLMQTLNAANTIEEEVDLTPAATEIAEEEETPAAEIAAPAAEVVEAADTLTETEAPNVDAAEEEDAADEATPADALQAELESVPTAELAPQSAVADEAPDETEPLAIPSIPQTANFNDPNLQMSDEEVRGRIISLKRVTEVNPVNDRAWVQLGDHYHHLGETEEAIAAYRQAIELEPTRGVYHYQLAQAYISQRRFEEAAKELEQVLSLDDTDRMAHFALAGSYLHLNMDEKAQEHLEIVAPSMEYEKAYNQACFEAVRGNVVRSVELLRTALRLEQTSLKKIANDPDFDFIRDEPIFEEFMNASVSIDE